METHLPKGSMFMSNSADKNQLVYELYGLSVEEVAIVEEATAS